MSSLVGLRSFVQQNWTQCDPEVDRCASDGFNCCTAPADVGNNIFTCRAAGFCSSDAVPDWSHCTPGRDKCASPGFTCCVAPADVGKNIFTCRGPGFCSSKTVPDWKKCNPGSDKCASGDFKCCVAPADVGNNVFTCRGPGYCSNQFAKIEKTVIGKRQNNYMGKWVDNGYTGAICVHTILLPNDRLLCVERFRVDPYPYNPLTNAEVATEINLKGAKRNDGSFIGTYTVVPIGDNPFCGGHSQRADGTIGFFGGDTATWKRPDGVRYPEGHFSRRIYHPCADNNCKTGYWQDAGRMTAGRWYPTVVTLHDGTQAIFGGVTGNLDLGNPDRDSHNPNYEYFPPKQGNWPRHLEILKWAFPYSLYPISVLLPSGNIFMFVSTKLIELDPRTEAITYPYPDLNAPNHKPWIYPYTPTFTVLPMTIKNNYKFVIKVCGGTEQGDIASKQCWQIDIATKKWIRSSDMPRGRLMPDNVLLPDGMILYLNGAGGGIAGGKAGEHKNTWSPVFVPDLYNPENDSWISLASAKYQRLYHSEAILVQTGHVITTGSEMMNIGDGPNCYPDRMTVCTSPFNPIMEQFTPPYMQLAESAGRPVITSAPARVPYKAVFKFSVAGNANDIARVTLIRYSSVTHSSNTDQRFFELPIAKREGNFVFVKAPWNPAMCPPGNWMLWALNNAGVPSESKTVLLYSDNQEYDFSPTPPADWLRPASSC